MNTFSVTIAVLVVIILASIAMMLWIQLRNQTQNDEGKKKDENKEKEEIKTMLALTKDELAKRIGTSRSALDRLLDPSKPSNIRSFINASAAVGKHLRIRMI